MFQNNSSSQTPTYTSKGEQTDTVYFSGDDFQLPSLLLHHHPLHLCPLPSPLLPLALPCLPFCCVLNLLSSFLITENLIPCVDTVRFLVVQCTLWGQTLMLTSIYEVRPWCRLLHEVRPWCWLLYMRSDLNWCWLQCMRSELDADFYIRVQIFMWTSTYEFRPWCWLLHMRSNLDADFYIWGQT